MGGRTARLRPYGGLRRVADVLHIIDGLIGAFDEFLFTVVSSIAEGDRVAIEATSSGRNGSASYDNIYLMRYELRGGKILSIREFFDAFEITPYLARLGTNASDAFGNRSDAGNAQQGPQPTVLCNAGALPLDPAGA